MNHETVEKNLGLMAILVLLTISTGALVEIVPLFFQSETTKPIAGLKPLTAEQLYGRDIYLREGCNSCHSQMIRPLRAETERYGHYSMAGEFVYDHPFLWGSKRTGPDLARVGGKYSDDWHKLHMYDPRSVVPESNMPAYPWLWRQTVDWQEVADTMVAMQTLGVPYTDAQIAATRARTDKVVEIDALVAYLQNLGTVIQSKR